MTDVTSRVGVEFTSVGDAQVLRSLDQVAASGTKTEASLDSVAMANKRLAAEAQRAAGSSKVLQQAGLNLTRQFSDVGVSLASGISPMMVLIQQGPQVADAFQMAKQQGLGFSAVVKGLAASLAPMAPIFLAVGAAVGVVAGAFALFERAVDKQSKYATTFGDTWRAVLKVVGDMIMDGPIGDGLRFLGDLFDRTLSAITNGAATYIARFVGFWGSAYNAIVNNWQNLPDALGAIVQNAVNVSLRNIEGFINATIGAINVLLKKANLSEIGKVSLGQIKVFNGRIADEIAADQKRIEAQTLASMSDFTRRVAAEADKNFLARQKAKKGGGSRASEIDEEARALKRAEEATAKYVAGLEQEIREIGKTSAQIERMAAAREIDNALKRGDIESAIRIRELILEKQGLEDLAKSLAEVAEAREAFNEASKMPVQFVTDPAKMAAAFAGMSTKIRQGAEQIIESFLRIRREWDEVFDSFRRRDWASAFVGLIRAIESVKKAFSEAATTGDKVAAVAAVGDAVGNAIGGRGGRAISSASNAGATAFAATGNPYVAAAAAALAGLTELLKSKPSNNGAGYSLVTGAFTGKSRTPETERAARAAGDIISGGQDLLRAAGLTLTETIHGLVVGTRDLSQVYTTGGRTITAAVGDAAAAAEAGLLAVLETATFASVEQEKVAKAALAAGKSFDQVLEVLSKYDAAQGITGALADQIKALTDPKGFDIAQVEKSIAQQRKDAAALAAEGFITAETLATINGQLDTLRGLQLDEVMRRYAGAVEDAADTALKAANDNAATAAGALSKAQDNLIEAYGREADALKATTDRFRALSSSLREYGGSLSGGAGGAGGLQFARALFQRTAGLAAQGDVGALGSLQRVSEAYLQAAQAAAPDARAYARDLAAVRNAVESAASVADTEAAAATAQLEALHQQVAQLVTLNESVLTVADAIGALAAATAANAAAQQALIDLQATAAPTTVAAPSSAPLAVDTSTLQAEIAALRTEVAGLRAENAAQLADIQRTNASAAGTLTRVTRDGEAMLTTTEAA